MLTNETYSNVAGTARHAVSGSTGFALGHYPDDPIFPGVMSLNLMQHLAEGLAGHLTGDERRAKGIKRVSYLSPVRPGDVLHIACDAPKAGKDPARAVIKSRLLVGERLVAKSDFLFDLS